MDAFQDLQQHAVFSHLRFFAEFGDDQSQKGVGLQWGQMQIERLVSIMGQLMDKEAQHRGFAQASLIDNQCNSGLLFKEFESSQGLFGVLIAEQPLDGWFFDKGVCAERKMFKKYHRPPFGLIV